MNYSVILLGATISVSLFIRICGAIEVTSGAENGSLSPLETQIDKKLGLGINDPLYQYAIELKRALGGDGKFKGDEEVLNQQVLDRVDFLRSPQKVKRTRITAERRQFEDDFYHQQICGIYHNDSFHQDQPRTVITDGSAPEGCHYQNDYKTTLNCDDNSLTEVPILPRVLTTLNVMNTKIREVNQTNFGDINITNVQFIHNDLFEIKPSAFANIKGIQTLEIMNNHLEYLAFDIYFGLTDVVSLYLDTNEISFEIYENCSSYNDSSEIPLVLPNLKVFSLRQNPIKIIPAQMWGGIRESPVAFLDMSQCSLEYIHEDSFHFLPNLAILYLTQNPKLFTPNLPIEAFKRIGKLEALSLGANGLFEFPTKLIEMFESTLQTLDLSGNPIDYLNAKDIPNFTKLSALNLKGCSLMNLGSTLNLLPTLRQIDLEDNFLTGLPDMSELTRLNYINIKGNPKPIYDQDDNNNYIKFTIPENAFQHMPNLLQIMMSGCPLREIKKNTFSQLKNLQMLFLENTNLTSIDNEAFEGLEKLTTLHLRHNKGLSSVNSLTFFGLPNLQYLYMDGCNLEFQFPPLPINEDTSTTEQVGIIDKSMKKTNLTPDYSRPFLYLPLLIHLELSNNKISNIYPQLFETNPNITELKLDGNKISSWDVPLLKPNYRKNTNTERVWKRFQMSGNILTYITEAMINDIVSFEADEVDLSNNIFMCDQGACKLRDIIFPPNGTQSIIPLHSIWLNNMTYTCVSDKLGDLVPIFNVSDATCGSFGQVSQEPHSSTGPSNIRDSFTENSNSTFKTLYIFIGVGAIFLVVLVVISYKKRAHIRYLIFRAKMNVTSLPRKSKMSTTDLIQYDYDTFISYHNQDRNFILEKFLPEVEDQSDESSMETKGGFKVCLHERDFEAGMPIAENIMESVDRSKKVVICISKSYLESQWCTFEMNLAYHRLIESGRKAFVVILLEDIPSNLRTKVLNYLMMSRTYLEWPGDAATTQELKRFWTRLRNSLQSV